MSVSPTRAVDLERARRSILRFQPASNWVAISRDPAARMTIGFGLDVSRAEGAETLARVGLDPAAVRSGRAPVSDHEMRELFDLALAAAVGFAERRVAGFSAMPGEQQDALLELIMWLGQDGAFAVFNEMEALSLPIGGDPPEPSPWFDEWPGGHPVDGRRHVPESEIRARVAFASYGLLAEVVSDDPNLLDEAEAMLPPGWRPAAGSPGVRFGLWSDGLITIDGARVERSPSRGARLLKLGAIVRHHVAAQAPAHTFVHAGVVDVGGCGIVIPGRSYTGKSMLVAELVRLGATYLSDEYAVLDDGGRVHPFPKPLSIRGGLDDPLGRLIAVPDERVAGGPVRAGLVVLTSYAPGREWRPTTRASGEGALALLQNTVSARLRPGPALTATSRLAAGAEFLVGRRGEAADAAAQLIEIALHRVRH